MVTIAVCRDLYPSWKSTVKYLDSLDVDIAVLPEGIPTRGRREWSIDDVVAHTANHPLILVSSKERGYGIAIMQKGKIEYINWDAPPRQYATENGPVTGLARICAMSLRKSPIYEVKSDLLIVSSSLAFPPKEIIEKHIHNLARGALIVMSTYELQNCWATDTTGKKMGEEVATNYGGYIKANIAQR